MKFLDPLRRIRRHFRVDEFTDTKIRAKFKRKYNIEIGLYSYGCFSRDRIDRNTTIGRYCSFSQTSAVFNRDHGISFITTAPHLHNQELGVVKEAAIEFVTCDIGDDVWVGQNAVITASARRIGRGAVIAAGAIVTRDVEPYTIVMGCPARAVRRRFPQKIIEKIEESRWWEWSTGELKRRISETPEMIYNPGEYFLR